VLNGKIVSVGWPQLWDPVFSPDGTRLLFKFIELDRVYRKVIPIEKLLS